MPCLDILSKVFFGVVTPTTQETKGPFLLFLKHLLLLLIELHRTFARPIFSSSKRTWCSTHWITTKSLRMDHPAANAPPQGGRKACRDSRATGILGNGRPRSLRNYNGYENEYGYKIAPPGAFALSYQHRAPGPDSAARPWSSQREKVRGFFPCLVHL